MHKDNYTKNTLYSLFGFGLLMISNFVFTSLSGRLLGPVYYGIFYSFFYFLMSFSQPNASLQLAAAKYMSEKKLPSINAAVQEFSMDFWLIGIVIFVILFALSPFLKILYGLESIWDVAFGAAIVSLWLVTAGYRGIYQGRMDFFTLGLNTGIEGIIRTVFGILFIMIGWKVIGALGASVIASFIVIFLLINNKGKIFPDKFRFKINKNLMGGFFKTFLVLVPFGLINSLDLTLVKYCVGGQESGYLSACALFGKNLVILSLVFSNVVYSYALKTKEGHFWAGLILTLLSFSSAALFTVFFGNWMVGFIFGKDYDPVVSMLPLYIIASLPLGIMQNIINFAIAKNVKKMNIIMWLLLIILCGIYYFTLKTAAINMFLIIMAVTLFIADGLLIAIVFISNWYSSKKALIHINNQ